MVSRVAGVINFSMDVSRLFIFDMKAIKVDLHLLSLFPSMRISGAIHRSSLGLNYLPLLGLCLQDSSLGGLRDFQWVF